MIEIILIIYFGINFAIFLFAATITGIDYVMGSDTPIVVAAPVIFLMGIVFVAFRWYSQAYIHVDERSSRGSRGAFVRLFEPSDY